MKTLDEFFDESRGDIKEAAEEGGEERKELYGYELPEDWDVVELGKIFREVSKKERKIRIEDDREYKLVTVKLYAKGIHLREVKKGEDIGTKTMYLVKDGDFIFSKIDARNGAYGFVPPELDGAVVSSDFPILNLRKDITSMDYVSYYLSQPIVWESIRNYAVGSTNRKRIKVEDFSKIVKIPLPPLEEQKKIVYVLRTIQRAIEQQDKLIETMKELKKSLMHRLFTKGLDASQPTKQTEIGEVPEHWKIARLGDIIDKRNETILPQQAKEIGLRYVGLEHIDGGSIFVNRWGYPEEVKSAKNRFYTGDILYGKLRPYLDKVVIAEWEGICSTDILVLTNKKTSVVDTLFVLYLMHTSRFIKYAVQTMKGVNHPRTSWNLIKEFTFGLPPLEEQKQIAQILQTVDRKIEIAKRKKDALQDLFKTMLHKLMTAQIKVKDLEIPSERIESLSV